MNTETYIQHGFRQGALRYGEGALAWMALSAANCMRQDTNGMVTSQFLLTSQFCLPSNISSVRTANVRQWVCLMCMPCWNTACDCVVVLLLLLLLLHHMRRQELLLGQILQVLCLYPSSLPAIPIFLLARGRGSEGELFLVSMDFHQP